MSLSLAGLLVNIVIAALLIATISYCWLLNKRIKILQDSKSELAQLMRHFDESTNRASESIVALQSASKKIGETIQMRIDKANYLVNDLSFMVEKGTKLADQMEASFNVNRARTKVMSEPAQEKEQAAPAPRRQAPPMFTPEATEAAAKPKTGGALESMLEKIAGRSGKALKEEPAATAENEAGRARSKAEQDLLNMLKGGMKS